jgi:hypothetical protein
VALPALCCLASAVAWPWGLACWLIYPAQILRLAARGSRPIGERALLAVFHVLARFPEGQGYLLFALRRGRHRRPEVIEYK